MKTVLITAGPTREYLDPIRFISNASSGKTGYEIAGAAARSGAKVTLISGPAGIKPPKKVKMHYAETAKQMKDTVDRLIGRADIFISAAAVGDWRPAHYHRKKIKKGGGALTVKFKENPDILKSVSDAYSSKKFIAGFALETGDAIKNAGEKLLKKKLDLIVVNTPENMAGSEAGGTIIFRNGRKKNIRRMPKERFASIIWDEIEKAYDFNRKNQTIS